MYSNSPPPYVAQSANAYGPMPLYANNPYANPAAAGAPPPPQQPPARSVPNTPASIFDPSYKWPRKGIYLICPRCGATVTTRVESSPTIITILGAVLLLLFTCILVCLPFCIRACKKSTHYCPYCNSVLGVREPLR